MQNKKSILQAISQGVGVETSFNPLGAQSQSCPAPKPTEKSVTINPNSLQSGDTDIITMKVTNTAAKTKLIPLGTLLAQAGFGEKFGVAELSVDDIKVVDEIGTANMKAQVLGAMITAHGVIAQSIDIFYGTDVTQAQQQAESITIDYNMDAPKRRKMRIQEINKDLNYTRITKCPVSLSMTKGILYPLLAGKTVEIQINVLAYGLGEDMYSSENY